jgi:hypothetical protein
MGRSTVMLKKFIFFLQVREGIAVKHVKVGGGVNSGLS